MDRLVYDLDPVLAFVREHQPVYRMEDMQAIGLERDGRLIGGVLFEGYNGKTIWMHVAGDPATKWCTRHYRYAAFAYPFLQLKVDAVRGYVDASNARALRFDKHLGFEEEARLTGAAADGGDVVIVVMRRENCRHV